MQNPAHPWGLAAPHLARAGSAPDGVMVATRAGPRRPHRVQPLPPKPVAPLPDNVARTLQFSSPSSERDDALADGEREQPVTPVKMAMPEPEPELRYGAPPSSSLKGTATHRSARAASAGPADAAFRAAGPPAAKQPNLSQLQPMPGITRAAHQADDMSSEAPASRLPLPRPRKKPEPALPNPEPVLAQPSRTDSGFRNLKKPRRPGSSPPGPKPSPPQPPAESAAAQPASSHHRRMLSARELGERRGSDGGAAMAATTPSDLPTCEEQIDKWARPAAPSTRASPWPHPRPVRAQGRNEQLASSPVPQAPLGQR